MKAFATTLGVHAQALQLRARRNDILASNIANAATPNFKARDIDFAAELRRVAGGPGPMTTTSTNHFSTRGSINPRGLAYRDPVTPALDGNTVDMGVEQMQFSENVLRYQTSLGFLNRRISGLMSAIKGE
ncbi:flagellar basal body rod protein FlgB [Plastorhodobacter daqingensis]|uniref:Flagellar basal body rod protein FlgB n=1 Tax=Plastorhodobacter daqingensis TaxID=1387281 RepID=A0ABW2UJM5_9RHOB